MLRILRHILFNYFSHGVYLTYMYTCTLYSLSLGKVKNFLFCFKVSASKTKFPICLRYPRTRNKLPARIQPRPVKPFQHVRSWMMG